MVSRLVEGRDVLEVLEKYGPVSENHFEPDKVVKRIETYIHNGVDRHFYEVSIVLSYKDGFIAELRGEILLERIEPLLMDLENLKDRLKVGFGEAYIKHEVERTLKKIESYFKKKGAEISRAEIFPKDPKPCVELKHSRLDNEYVLEITAHHKWMLIYIPRHAKVDWNWVMEKFAELEIEIYRELREERQGRRFEW